MAANGENGSLILAGGSSRFDGMEIDFSNTVPENVFNKEVRRVHLHGKLANFIIPDVCNLIENRFCDLECQEVDFSRCDLKDNAITKCLFSKSKFVGCGFVLNTVSNSHFCGCNFYDTVIQNCEFYDVEFNNCDFTSLVIKDCVFTRCVFNQCETSNKLFEMCLLNDCRFAKTQLQIQTVLENFGLYSKQVETPLRSDRVDHAPEVIQHCELESKLSEEKHPLGRLSLYFYLNGDLLAGSEHLDAALDVAYWIRTQATIGSFSVIFTRFCEFLLRLHDNGELAYLPLIKLHSVTGSLASGIPPDSRMRQAEFAVYGAHLSIARQIEDFGLCIRNLASSRRRNWTFLVDGEHPKSFYKRELPELFERGNPRIASLIPHNSPWEMVLAFPSSASVGTFMALFLATRTRIELHRITDCDIATEIHKRRSKRPSTPVAQVTLGGARSSEAKPLFHLSTHVTSTLSVDFQLSVSTRCIKRIRQVMLSILK